MMIHSGMINMTKHVVSWRSIARLKAKDAKAPGVFSRGLQPASALRAVIDGRDIVVSEQGTSPCQPFKG